MQDAYICDAIRTPIGRYGGALSSVLAELQRRQARYALCTMCIGVGQGIALIIERV